jgi:hypothetical protein
MLYEERSIRAFQDDNTITVYQAFNRKIADTAVQFQTFTSPPFKMDRMTWIKPSFLWMMYRSGWAKKEADKQILSIKITKKGFEEALNLSCLSTFHDEIHDTKDDWKIQLSKSPVRIQWDPERNIFLQPLNYRTIQIGLSDIAVFKYVNEWITEIKNITMEVDHIYTLLKNENIEQAMALLPIETYYQVPSTLAKKIGITLT